jgi:hypothetical protein
MKLDLLLYCSRPNVKGTLIKIPKNIPTSVYAKLTFYKIQMVALYGIIHAISIVWMWYLVKLQWFLINTVCFWQCIKCIKYYTIRFQAHILLLIKLVTHLHLNTICWITRHNILCKLVCAALLWSIYIEVCFGVLNYPTILCKITYITRNSTYMYCWHV